LAPFAPRPITTISASRLLATNSKTAITNISKEINLYCPNKSYLKTLIKKNIALFIKSKTILAAITPIKKDLNNFKKPIFKLLLPNLPAIILTKISLPQPFK